MRPHAFIIILTSCAALHAQDQERKMLDRILRPDMTLANPMQAKAYYGGSGAGVDTSKEAAVKDFYFIQKFSAKDFDTKQYEAKNFWQGDFQFTTKAAYVKTDADAGKLFA